MFQKLDLFLSSGQDQIVEYGQSKKPSNSVLKLLFVAKLSALVHDIYI